jgi:cysteinyl-tRNA synthetase
MYTDNALKQVRDIMKEANASIEEIYQNTRDKLSEEQRVVKSNQSELKSQLEDLIDTQKYLRLIEDENRRQQVEKEKGTTTAGEKSSYAAVQPEIRINKDYFIQNGIPLDEAESETGDETGDEVGHEMSEEELAAISAELDNEYFDWKEGEEAEESGKKGFSLFGKIKEELL